MAKDPAFLFYTSDFLTGTSFMTDDQVGKYIRLLCLQHQTGHLSYEDMLKICKTHDKHIFGKFVQDSESLFYNERLELESVKRKKYSESRAKNRTSKKDGKPTYDPHMENENEDTLVVVPKPIIIGHLEKFLQDTVSKETAYKFVKALDKPMSIEQIEKLAPAHDAQFQLSNKGGDYTKWCQYLCYFLRDFKPSKTSSNFNPDGTRKMTPR